MLEVLNNFVKNLFIAKSSDQNSVVSLERSKGLARAF